MSSDERAAAHPVVTIDVRAGEIKVNGEDVAHEEHLDRHTVAVHAVARRVAAPLGRAVRVVATDDAGQTRLVVHPDGSVTDLEEIVDSDVAVLEEMLAANGAVPPREQAGDQMTQGRFTVPAGSSAEDRASAQIVPPRPPSTSPAGEVAVAPAAGMTPAGPSGPSGLSGPSGPSGPSRGGSHASRPSFITVGRTVQPAERGWRGGLNKMGLRLDPGPEERAYRDDVAAVSRHWPGTRTVAVANQKGSAGKTPASLCLAACFARHGGAGVLAWDNNETEGTMRFRTEWSAHEAPLLNLLPKVDQLLAPSAAAAEMSNYVHHQPGDKYDVLWSDTTIDGEHVVTAEDVEAVHRVASRYYRMLVMDSGNSNRAPNWRAMIAQADALVVPCTNVEDTAEVGARLLETLANRDEHSAELARNALVVVSQRSRVGKNMDRIVRDFQGLARRVVSIPYDPALETGVIRFSALSPSTQRAWLAAAAALTEYL